ncbi:MAG: GIVxVP protein [Vulcanococcus sp.]
MSLNRTARGIVLVPSLLLGGAFLAAAAWGGEGAAGDNRPLALGIGAVLMVAGMLTQLLPVARTEAEGEPAGEAEGPEP